MLRVLWTAPKQLPSWTCECFGVACGEEHPEVITNADKEVWRHLGTGSRSVVSSYTSSSKPLLRPPSVLSRPIVAAPVVCCRVVLNVSLGLFRRILGQDYSRARSWRRLQ